MTAVAGIVSRRGFIIKCIIETNLERLSWHCLNHYFQFNSPLKQLYINNKMEYFSYKGGCGISILRHLKEELTLAMINGFGNAL